MIMQSTPFHKKPMLKHFLCCCLRSPFPKRNWLIGEKRTNKQTKLVKIDRAPKAKSSSNRRTFNERKNDIETAITPVVSDYMYTNKASSFIDFKLNSPSVQYQIIFIINAYANIVEMSDKCCLHLCNKWQANAL